MWRRKGLNISQKIWRCTSFLCRDTMPARYCFTAHAIAVCRPALSFFTVLLKGDTVRRRQQDFARGSHPHIQLLRAVTKQVLISLYSVHADLPCTPGFADAMTRARDSPTFSMQLCVPMDVDYLAEWRFGDSGQA